MKSFLKILIEKEIEKTIKILTEGIIHLDKLKPEELLNFLKSWNLDKAKFHVSEKMDGNYMAIGVSSGFFYLRSKNRVFTSAEEVPNIFFMSDFKKYYQMLEIVPWNEIFSKMANKWGFEFNGTFEIEGEAIPAFDHNIVVYDEAKIGDGIFVIFNTKSSSGKDKTGQFHNPEMWVDLANELNKYSSVKFFSVPEVDLSDLEFNNDLIIDLEALIKEHGNFLSKPARTQAAKELKNKLLDRIAELGQAVKQQALQHSVQSKFGPEVEGVVISGPDGKLIKIVDTAKFTSRKETNWHFINQLINAERNFKKSVKEDPLGLKDHLNEWQREIETVQNDFEKNGHKYITIKKKFIDTENGIKYALDLIEIMNSKLKAGAPPEKIIEDFNNKKIIPESSTSSTKLIVVAESSLNEGGKVFNDANSVVPKSLLEPSIKNALIVAGLEGIDFEVVGNKFKPFFSDIDIAINMDDLVKHFKMDLSRQNFWEELDSHLAQSNVIKYSIIKGLNQFHILVPLIDSSGEQIKAFLPDGSRSDEMAMIQIDIFVGNVEWMKDVTSGAPVSSKYKASYRNMLLSSIAATVKWATEGSDENEYYRYVMNFRDGLRQQKVKLIPQTKETSAQKKILHDKVITSNPNDLAQILFGSGVTWSNMNSFEELYSLLNGEKFKFKDFLPKIMEDFISNLKKRNMEIPKEIKN